MGEVGVDLYWIPLGAGAHVVRMSGRAYEALSAFVQRRPRYRLYHAALVVGTSDGRYTIESAPIRDDVGSDRGVVAEGPVGMRWLGRFRPFRYEIRRWRDGSIPDLAEAVMSPVRVAGDDATARGVLELLPLVPLPVWGRDELRTGDMWNSNSVVSWVLSRAGVDLGSVGPPPGGRAPGWDAGQTVARREPGHRAAQRSSGRDGAIRGPRRPHETSRRTELHRPLERASLQDVGSAAERARLGNGRGPT